VKSAQYYLVHDFSDFLGNFYDHKKFTEAASFHPVQAKKNQQKFLTCLRGGNKFSTLLLFFWIDFAFCCFEHSLEPQFDSL
jgi:hypothetical protein